MPSRVDISPQALDEICSRLIAGESMGAIAAKPQSTPLPSLRTIYERMADTESVRTAVAHAREAQQHAMADQTIDLADSATAMDYNAVKLRIWARQWYASKLAPKVYGDKLAAEVSGPGGAGIPVTLAWAEHPDAAEAEAGRAVDHAAPAPAKPSA